MHRLQYQLIFALSCVLLCINCYAQNSLCLNQSTQQCHQTLLVYPFFDTQYKMAANYVPILPLRALAHADVYKNKKNFELERYYYVKDLQGKFKDPYAVLKLNGQVKGRGFLGRDVEVHGTLNDFNLEYMNIMTFSLPKKAHMLVTAKLDGIEFLNLEIFSDGDKMTNDVSGKFFGKKVKYNTCLRNTEGLLAEVPYSIFTHGIVSTPQEFKTVLEGRIGKHLIDGQIYMVSKNNYLSIENYGPIQVKSYVRVID